MLDYFKESHIARNPPIIEINSSKFYLCAYTGSLIYERVGIPEFLLNDPASVPKREGLRTDDKQRMWGAFRDWNTLARFLMDGVEMSLMTALHADAILQWISAYTNCTNNVTIPPKRDELERFGGTLSEDKFFGTYTMFNAKAIHVNNDEDSRELEKALRKEKTESQPPKLAGAIKNLLLPNQLTHLHVTAATPSVFWIERAAAPWSPSNVEAAVLQTAQKDFGLAGASIPAVETNKLAPEYYGPAKCPRNVTRMFARPVPEPVTKALPASHVNPTKKRSASGANKKDITGAPLSAPVGATSAPKKSQKVAIETD